MSFIPTKQIDGDVAVGRSVSAGGNANIQGNARVGHNLVVRGWVDAPNIKGALKGLYVSEAALKEAYPEPMPGWFALVGDTLPAAVWRVDGGKWVPTGETGGEFSVYLDRLENDVGDVMEEVAGIKELLLRRCIVLGESIVFSSTGDRAVMGFTVLKGDGSVKKMESEIPVATQENAGVMSTSDKRALDLYAGCRPDYLEVGMEHGEGSVTLGCKRVGPMDDMERQDVVLKAATHEAAGVMSAADKRKLDGIVENPTTVQAMTIEEVIECCH